ncbi:MAG: serine/threonine protein kinase [Candidatus Obscuribacterales bacterium]|nr:serine/threonine protein kinase [Candidatus Obscuribacterales bacterium]
MAGGCILIAILLINPFQPSESQLRERADKLVAKIVDGQVVSPSAPAEFLGSGASWMVLTGKDGKQIASFGAVSPRTDSTGPMIIGSQEFRQFKLTLANGMTACVAYAVVSSTLPVLILLVMTLGLGTTLALIHLSVLNPVAKLRQGLKGLAPDQDAKLPAKTTEPMASQQVTELVGELNNSLTNIVDHYQNRMKQLQSELQVKERLTNLIVRKLAPCTSRADACDALMMRISKDFPEVLFQFVIEVSRDNHVLIVGSHNLSEASLHRLTGPTSVLASRLSRADVISIEGDALAPLGLNVIDEAKQCGEVFAVKLAKDMESSVYLCGAIKGSVPSFEKYLRQLSENCGALLETIIRYEKERNKASIDRQTGLFNSNEFSNYSTELLRLMNEGHSRLHATIFLLEGDTFSKGRSNGHMFEESMKELANLVKQKIDPRPRGGELLVGDRIFRYDRTRLIAVVEGTQRNRLLRVGEELAKAAQSCGMPIVRLSMARFPEQGDDLEEALRLAEVGIEYCRSENLPGFFVDSATIPMEFTANLLGEEAKPATDGTLSPNELLQAMKLSRQTAILKIASVDGRRSWMYIQDGAPTRAGVGNIAGKDAVIEVLATFDEATVQLHQVQDFTHDQIEQLAPNDRIYWVRDTVETLLHEGTQAKSNYEKSKFAFSNPKLHVFPCSFNPQVWERLNRTVPEDVPLMKKILLLSAGGSRNCVEIVASLENDPSYRVWRAMTVLMTNKMIRLSRLKLQSVGPEFSEPSKYCQTCHTRHPVGGCSASYSTENIDVKEGTFGANSAPHHIDPSVPLEDQLMGKTIAGKYRIDSLIGEGGMAKVFKATHTGLDREVVIKIMQVLPSIDTDLKRFERECKVTAKINHPNVISVFDVGTLDTNRPYLVMEFVEGESLRQYLDREGCMSLEDAAVVMIQVCCGLSEAHSKGVIHRDLKPENIMLRNQPDRPDWVKIVDFGIAHLRHTGTHFTRGGMAVGTADYMSPEYLSDKPLDHRADVYALGIIFYELLTGRTTFEAATLEEMFAKHISALPRPLSYYRPDLPPGCLLDQIAEKALQKNPDDRWDSVLALRTALEHALQEMLVS